MTKELLQQAHDALLSARHAIRNLLQGKDKADWPKWLEVSDQTDAAREQIEAALGAGILSDTQKPAADTVPFEDWWEREGQFLRAGGGQYEKTFAYHAWETAKKDAATRIAELELERDALRSELAEARAQMERQRAEWLAWDEKRKALELDADRYRHLRRGGKPFVRGDWNGYLGDYKRIALDELDAAIDLAMQGKG